MPRNDDDFDDEDRSRPRRRPRDDEDDDRPARPRRPRDEDDDAPPRKKGNGLVIGILIGVLVVCCGGGGTAAYFIYRGLKKTVEQIGTTVEGFTEAEQSRQNLTQIGSAIQQYERARGAFPNNSYEVGAKPSRALLSWRVHILPYLGQDALYKQFKLDEPWDSPNNIKLLNQMPAVYGSPGAQKKAGAGKTFYRGFSAPGGIFEKPSAPGGKAPTITKDFIPDGTANTILVVDAGDAVEWTKPDDLDFGPGRPRPNLGGAYPNVPFVMVLMADGTVHQMVREVPDDTLKKLIDRKDGWVIPAGWEANR
jgi:hypothetical protein